MASILGTRLIMHPSFVEPEPIVTMAQPSGFLATLAGRKPRVRLGTVDKFVYATSIDLSTQVDVNQASHNLLPNATIAARMLSTATYMVRTRADYSDLDVMEAGEWNISLPLAYRLANRQGHFQYMRMACLYGVNASNGEGLANAAGATAVTLPTDPYGNTRVSTYDPGALALFFLGQMSAALARMYMAGMPARFTIIGPQRTLLQIEWTNVVQLTNFFRAGAGSATTGGMITSIAESLGCEVDWAYDDTLIGQGVNGYDLIMLVVPEIAIPAVEGINTNVFASIAPQIAANTLMYADVPAPVESITPIPEGVDVVSRMRISSGWVLRGQSITLISAPF